MAKTTQAKASEEAIALIDKLLSDGADFYSLSQAVNLYLHNISPQKENPVGNVTWVDIKDVVANEYNPNSVAKKEMKLLAKSIEEDGYTQPVVVVKDPSKNKYVIIDGFHRTMIAKTYKNISKKTGGKLPVVILNKTINQRIASTVRHNRARGTHAVESMSTLVFKMLNNGMSDADVANQLGMEAEEVLRLKHITGYSNLYKDAEYSKAWITTSMLLNAKKEEQDGNEPFRLKNSL